MSSEYSLDAVSDRHRVSNVEYSAAGNGKVNSDTKKDEDYRLKYLPLLNFGNNVQSSQNGWSG